MKKTNIRIEIKAKDLAKKILDKNNGSPPSVYGEEKPTGKNIPLKLSSGEWTPQ